MSHQRTDHTEHEAAPRSAQRHDEHVSGVADHSGHGGHGDHAAQFRDRFWRSLALTVPVVAFSAMFADLLGYSVPDFPGASCHRTNAQSEDRFLPWREGVWRRNFGPRAGPRVAQALMGGHDRSGCSGTGKAESHGRQPCSARELRYWDW